MSKAMMMSPEWTGVFLSAELEAAGRISRVVRERKKDVL